MKGQEKLEPKKKKGELFLSSFSTSKMNSFWMQGIPKLLMFYGSEYRILLRYSDQSIQILIDSQPYLWIAIV